MLMISGPGRVDRPQKTTRNRRATDAGAGTRPDAVSPAQKTTGATRFGRRSTDPKPQPSDPAAEDGASAATPRIGRPYAPLVAQLIGAKLGVAQSRIRRRGSTAEAIAAYRHIGDRGADEHALTAEA